MLQSARSQGIKCQYNISMFSLSESVFLLTKYLKNTWVLYFATSYKVCILLAHTFFLQIPYFLHHQEPQCLLNSILCLLLFFFFVQNTACESFAVCFSNLALITNLLIFYLLFFHGTYYCRSHNGNQNLSFVFVWKLEKYFSSKSVFPIETKFQNYILEALMQMRVYVCICMQFCM